MKFGASTLIANIGLAAPAVRALNGAGYSTLEDVAKISDMALASLHGFGPKALKQLRQALVVMADKDYIPDERGQELARLLKGEFVVFPKSTHMSYLFKPKRLLEKLVPFLDTPLPE